MNGDADRHDAIRMAALQRNALIVGAALLLVCTLYGALVFHAHASFFRAYLIAFEFWLSVSLGCMAVMMIRHLTGGAWGLYLRPLLEGGAMLIPLLGVLFVPLLLGLAYVYPWRTDFIGGSQFGELTDNKRIWFEFPFFVVRALVYFGVWTFFAWLLNMGTREPANAQQDPPRRFRVVSALGLAAYGLTITFASIDWSMSLNPLWFSSMYGPMYASGQLLAGFAFVVLTAALLAKTPPAQLFRDFGNLLLAFTLIWAYLSFSQFLLIWAGNLPEETVYYRPRVEGGWGWMAVALVLGQFALPFLLLLAKRVKVSPRLLAVVAGISLFMHFIDLVWLTVPSFPDASWDLIVLAPALVVGVGGIWLSLFVWRLQRRPFHTAAALHLEVPTYE